MANKLGLMVLLGMSCNFPTLSALGTDGGNGGADSSRSDSGGGMDGNGGSGCTPSTTTCTGDTLTICDAAGHGTTTTCALGCESGGSACKTFTPSNGLATALGISGGEPDVVFPSTVTINTDTGTVLDSSGNTVNVTSLTIAQTGSGVHAIRAFIAHSFDITNAVVTGSNAVAFVSDSTITIHGYFDASANLTSAGPGALEYPSNAIGTTVGSAANGGGGGGNATAGGSGTSGNAGGLAQAAFSPLAGGGRGGVDGTGTPPGGGGGGAVQLVAASSVSVSGILDVGGGGGGSGGNGGGAGGTIIVESPTIDVEGIVAANGGGGGGGPGCGSPTGQDGLASATVAAGGGCTLILIVVIKPFAQPEIGGSGGTGSSAPFSGTGIEGGGGGAAGRIQINTATGTFTQGTDAVVSGAVTNGTLAIH